MVIISIVGFNDLMSTGVLESAVRAGRAADAAVVYYSEFANTREELDAFGFTDIQVHTTITTAIAKSCE